MFMRYRYLQAAIAGRAAKYRTTNSGRCKDGWEPLRYNHATSHERRITAPHFGRTRGGHGGCVGRPGSVRRSLSRCAMYEDMQHQGEVGPRGMQGKEEQGQERVSENGQDG